MREQSEREAIRREMSKKGVVYRLPGMDALPMRRDLTYTASSGSTLLMDVYYPSPPPPRRLPVVLMPLAYPDPEGRVRSYGPVTSWARLLAASGMAAVVFGAEAPDEDVHLVLRHLRADAGALGLDVERVGLFAASANVTVALSALMRDRHLRCAALLYGYTMDQDGLTGVADASRQFGFVNACAGRTVNDLRDDAPMLFVRAGQDGFPGVNEALDRLIAGALARNLPFTLINYATGGHGFDLDEDTEMSRGIIQQVLAFLRAHLAPGP